MVKTLPATRETRVQSLGWEDPLENGKTRQYSCLENSVDRGTCWATVHGGLKELDFHFHLYTRNFADFIDQH